MDKQVILLGKNLFSTFNLLWSKVIAIYWVKILDIILYHSCNVCKLF